MKFIYAAFAIALCSCASKPPAPPPQPQNAAYIFDWDKFETVKDVTLFLRELYPTPYYTVRPDSLQDEKKAAAFRHLFKEPEPKPVPPPAAKPKKKK